VFLHGVGATPEDMAPIARYLMEEVPDTACVLLGGPERFDGGAGRQWFPVAGVTKENRPSRVTAALPGLVSRIDALAKAENVAADAVTIVGFSQGATMTLALVAGGYPFRQAVCLAGRRASAVRPASAASPTVILSHGVDDLVIPVSDSEDSTRTLTEQGYVVHFLPVLGLGHTTSAEQLSAVRTLMKATSATLE